MRGCSGRGQGKADRKETSLSRLETGLPGTAYGLPERIDCRDTCLPHTPPTPSLGIKDLSSPTARPIAPPGGISRTACGRQECLRKSKALAPPRSAHCWGPTAPSLYCVNLLILVPWSGNLTPAPTPEVPPLVESRATLASPRLRELGVVVAIHEI